MKTINELLENFKKDIFETADVVAALSLSEKDAIPLFHYAEEVCEQTYGKGVFVRGIIEISNICRKNCNYCGIRKDNANIKRYRIPFEEVLETVGLIKNDGVHTIVMQSGEDLKCDEYLPELIKIIRTQHDVAVTLSTGERPLEVYKQYKDAGVDRFLLRIETTDETLFKQIHPDDNLQYRKECLYLLKELGFEVGTGIMVGLPGQTLDSIVEDLYFFRQLQPDMVGIGPFLPQKDTPFKDKKNESLFLTLKVLALIRIMLKDVNLPATTAMGTMDPIGRQKALKVGANVIMPNYTPLQYREHYKLYDKKICASETCTMVCTSSIVAAAGKYVVEGKGFRKRFSTT